MDDFTDSSVSSNEATSDMSKEEAVDKDDDNEKEVTNVDELTKVTDDQDFMGMSHISITVEEKPFTEEKRHEELLIKPSETSFPGGIDEGLSATVRDVGGRLLPGNTTGEAFERWRQGKKKIKVVKVGDGIILLPDRDNGADHMTIREARNPSECGERTKQSEEFGYRGSLERLDVMFSRSAGDINHARFFPVKSQPCDGSEKKENNNKEHARHIKEEEEEVDNEFTPLLDNEALYMVIPEAHAPAAARESAKQSKESKNLGSLERFEVNIFAKDDGGSIEEENTSDEITPLLDTKVLQLRIPETDFQSEHEEERISQSGEPSEQGGLCHLDVILSTASEITSMKDPTADFRLDGKTEDDLNTEKTENENNKEDKTEDEVKSSTKARPLPQPKKNTEEQQEMEGDSEQAVDFSVKDVLCFAWQIAKGMVSAQIKNILD